MPDRFESFDLLIERVGETYRVQVTDSPVGPRRPVLLDPISLDPGEPIPGEDGGTIRDVRRRPLAREDLLRLGERLFSAVFVKAVAEAFRTSVVQSRGKGFGLRIRLQLDEAPELAGLPWEAMWDPTDRAFLADRPDLPVVRSLRVTAEAPAVGPTHPPLRLLALLPEPDGECKLNGATEWQRIQERLEPLIERGLVTAERIGPPTLKTLAERIEDIRCDVLHIVAHGGPGDPRAGGLLKLEDASGAVDSVTGNELARALERRRAPRLVVLNACYGARAVTDDAFDGLAQHLLSRGVPAVVAMRTSISDAAAVAFAVELYGELVRGRTMEAAMVNARRHLALGKYRSEWATPVLYMRGEDVRIFDAGSVADFVLPAPEVGPRSRRVFSAALAAVATAALGYMVRPRAEDPCPPPPGLHDLRFVRIEAGESEDGSVAVEKAYCIATKELSRRDWLAVMPGALGRPGRAPDMPVTDMTVEEANEFLKALTDLDPNPVAVYRLPTVDEWEYAARAGSPANYFFGDDPSELYKYGNCEKQSGSDGYDLVAPIGSFKPNRWGLYDVHGNVAEWVQWPEGAGLSSIEDGKVQSLRLGGSFESTPENCGFSSKWRAVVADDSNRGETGIRVVRELNDESSPPG